MYFKNVVMESPRRFTRVEVLYVLYEVHRGDEQF